MAGNKKKAQNIKTQLRAVSVEKLTKSVEATLNVPDPDEPLDIDLLATEWAGPSPPHVVDGTCCEERRKIKEREKNGNTR